MSSTTVEAAAPVKAGGFSHGGRGLMTVGSLLGTGAVLAWSQVTNLLQLYAVFAVIGVACSMVLYQAAFAVIVAWYDGNQRGRANGLPALTIVAGFAMPCTPSSSAAAQPRPAPPRRSRSAPTSSGWQFAAARSGCS